MRPDPRAARARRGLARIAGAAAVAHLLLASRPARAQAAPPAGHDDQAFDVMNLLSRKGLHDIHDESWNIYGQFTYISSWMLPFSAKYTNQNGSINSLTPEKQRSYTGSFTLFLGTRLWPGAVAYFVPEIISEKPLSSLRGLGGAIQNFELQKTGSSTPQLYRARTFVRQTINLGGEPVVRTSDPMQLGRTVRGRRLVLTVGNFSILDMFDRNSVTADPRQTFLNMAFMTYAAYDFASDARGYSWGGVAELFFDDWAVRVGRITPPKNPNQLQVDFRLDKFYGDQLEVEHVHRLFGQNGAVRVLAYRNHLDTGRFDDAIAAFQADHGKNAAACTAYNYGSGNTGAPDLCWVRRPNVKVGIGLNLEQYLTDDLAVFLRGMVSDGQTEVYAYTSTDRSLSFGALAKGEMWHRPFDLAGVGFGLGWISQAHIDYLRLGGVDGFIGDGFIRPGAESVLDVFYSFNLFKALWLTADYQHITNPAFNRDRGPVDIFAGRVHAEF